MKEHNCPNCGAPITRGFDWEYICSYCGTAIEMVPTVKTTIVLDRKDIVPLRAEIRVPFNAQEYMSEEDIRIQVEDGLVRKFAESLPTFIEIYKNVDIETMSTTYRGVLKVKEI